VRGEKRGVALVLTVELCSLTLQRGNQTDEITAHEVGLARARIASMGIDATRLSDDDVRRMIAERARRFLEEAPTTAAEAATIILDGVRNERWRILVGHDAERIDKLVRETPERAYETEFFEAFAKETGWVVGGR
jgi:hypothetical protein